LNPKRNMRIAYVSADPGVPVFGRKGCSIHVQEVLRAMAQRGIVLDLFTTSGEGERPAGLESVCLHSLGTPPRGEAAVREQALIAINSQLRSQLEQHGPFDLVYERYSLWSFAPMDYARERGLPGLLEVNAPLIEEQARYRVLVDRATAENVAERVFDAARVLLPVSDEVAAYLQRFAGARGKVHVLANGVNPERFSGNILPALPTPESAFTVGFVGTLKAWHGLTVLIDAFDLLRAGFPSVRLLLVGDGPERQRLGADVAARGLSTMVLFAGAVAWDAVPAWLASMDVAVAPYPRLESFYFSPLKVYEYMAAGIPVVASRCGQLEQLIESGVNGLLTPPEDAGALAASLELLLTNAPLRKRLGGAGRAKVLREHTWDKVVGKILGLAGLKGQTQTGSGQTSTVMSEHEATHGAT
jgi:glycosyltransferase involved in cell wall biosynthesis